MKIQPSVTVSVRPTPLATDRPAANPRGTDAAPSDRAQDRIVPLREPPLANSVRLATEGLMARRVSGDVGREGPEPGSKFDLRAHLAEIDRDTRKRLENLGREQGLSAGELRDISRAFHAKMKKIYEAARGTDVGPQRVNRAVRRAFQGVRAELLAKINPPADPGTTVGVTPGAGGNGVPPTTEVPPVDDTSSAGSTTSTIPGVTVSVGTAPPPPPIPVADPAEELDPLAVLANALTQFVNRFDSMMDLFEALIADNLGLQPGGEGEGSASPFEIVSNMLDAQQAGATEQNG